MGNLRSTVVMKTDIRGFTTKVGMLSELDLGALLKSHKEFILNIAGKYDGKIVKGEGDAFWMTFPSVTSASLAAFEIQEELRLMQAGKSDAARLAVRIVITLGDVLHHDKDIFGEAVNLAARIESITPADETYLSHAAWLALNKSEVKASSVGEFNLKGIAEASQIYKLDLKHKTRVIEQQIIVFTDVEGATSFAVSHDTDDVERLLTHHEAIHGRVCEQFGGTVRMFIGDACFMTFPNARMALDAISMLLGEWSAFKSANGVPCSLKVAAHKGDVHLFRSYLFGKDINFTVALESALGKINQNTDRAIVSKHVKDDVVGTEWEVRLSEMPDGNSDTEVEDRSYLYDHKRVN